MGSESLATGSILAAFFAGMVALFAPCCIVFLAPSYLAAAIKNNRWRLLPLTFVFAAGLALVLVPITLGVSLIAGAIARYHEVLYWAGGLLMIGLGILALSGRMWSMPSTLRAPAADRGDSATFFSLGVFSGIASSCCAPVLVGVMTLSALSGNPGGGLLLGLAFVFGMVIPLFVMALLWDAVGLSRHRWGQARPLRISLPGGVLRTNTINLLVAAGFTVMGVWIITLASSETMTGPGNDFQRTAGASVTRAAHSILTWLQPVPEPILGIGLLGVALSFVWFTLRDRRRDSARISPQIHQSEHGESEPCQSCHETHTPSTR
ncbi:cytochrome c biogenesis CcdA family protein [Acidipropionibacterium thoenii]|uniref:cytochrome c biogenesis CcdA family protein n=1 Tax=Acidipropionibacterium thoenii TaxID=1751 RepID=UPI00040F7204|nr:cytochrome c biogenesis CcdA family protein [Acidipropionibacterium thoenii]